MALSNYTELQASVSGWLNKSNLTSVVPDFIRLAEARFGRLPQVEKQRTGAVTTVASKSVVALPADFKEFGGHGGIYYDDNTRQGPLEFVGADTSALTEGRTGLFDSHPRRATMLDLDTGPALFLSPKPNAAFTLRLIYTATLEALSGSVSTNWLLDEAPDIYLFGALLESAPYLKDDERIPVWEKRFASALAELAVRNQRFHYGAHRVTRPSRPIGPVKHPR